METQKYKKACTKELSKQQELRNFKPVAFCQQQQQLDGQAGLGKVSNNAVTHVHEETNGLGEEMRKKSRRAKANCEYCLKSTANAS